MRTRNNEGFTLVEISVVLVIIALLAGGTLVARDMIANSKLTVVAEEKARVVSAIKLFQDKYYSLPGDFSQAVGLWGQLSPFQYYTTRAGSTGGTFDGNGDGEIRTNNLEEQLLWHHLAMADLMPFEYEGLSHETSYLPREIGKNMPQSHWKNDAGWYGTYIGEQSGVPAFFDGSYGHVIRLIGSSTTIIHTKTMTPGQQQRLDIKYDDGEADEGKIRSFKANNCVAGTNYNVALSTVECVPIWIAGF